MDFGGRQRGKNSGLSSRTVYSTVLIIFIATPDQVKMKKETENVYMYSDSLIKPRGN